MRWNYQYEKYHYFLNICEQIRISNNYSLNSQETVREALSKPAPSFFLTAQRISRIISETRLNVDGVKTGTYRQNREILRRYFRIKRENPAMSKIQIARIIEKSGNTEWYMTEKSALNLYYKLLRRKPRYSDLSPYYSQH